MTNDERVWVAVYMRVSSDDQRDRETIKTQREAIERFLGQNPHYTVFRYYEDDGVSGTIPIMLRPAGKDLVADAKAARFKKIIVLRASRLGRDEIDLLSTYRLFVEQLEIELVGVAEPLGDQTMFGYQAISSGHYRRMFLTDSARDGSRRARRPIYGWDRPTRVQSGRAQADRPPCPGLQTVLERLESSQPCPAHLSVAWR